MSQTDKRTELTKFSHGAGCGCKVAPQILQQMLSGRTQAPDRNLIVGNNSNDDAAVYDMGNGTGLIATTDFFTPIVDDAYQFGQIAAANAISDVYAMGGRPLLALAILGWPVETLPPELAAEVIDGGRNICEEAGISLAGGHTIDSKEPVFGLAVNGTVGLNNLKKNTGASEGDLLFLTKPLGTGIFSTAMKRGVLEEGDYKTVVDQLRRLNSIGEKLGQIKAINAMTDVTGFGLLGHLIEMADGSEMSAEIYYSQVPKIRGLEHYLKLNTVPDATYRNWNAYQSRVAFDEQVNMMEAFTLLPDPQTNGGLLFAVNEKSIKEIRELLEANGLHDHCEPIGRIVCREEKTILVKQ